MQGEAMLMIWDWQSWFEMDSEQRMLLTVKGLGSRGRSLMWRRLRRFTRRVLTP